ncbi:Uncharacterized protein TCM_024320 [Theobroma cacao]|uniref:Uncharacterized protein n=1 Tax=Theobroma cacao TaxID=3641 RepID=A0A061EWE3_THECC|nr:Uncharacterized protein TCM_024320 [Theobroma cacao]
MTLLRQLLLLLLPCSRFLTFHGSLLSNLHRFSQVNLDFHAFVHLFAKSFVLSYYFTLKPSKAFPQYFLSLVGHFREKKRDFSQEFESF